MSTESRAGLKPPVQISKADISSWLHEYLDRASNRLGHFTAAGAEVEILGSTPIDDLGINALIPGPGANVELQVSIASLEQPISVEGLERLRRDMYAAQVESRYFLTLEISRGNVFVFDQKNRRAFWGLRPNLPEWHKSSPLRQVLHLDAATRGAVLLHAAMVGHGDKCVLLAGPSHAGKSTATAWAVAEGYSSGGDDYVALTRSSSWLASPLYRIVKLRDGSPALGSIDHLPNQRIEEESRTLFYLDPAVNLLSTAQVHAIVTIGDNGDDRRLRRVSAADALKELAPSTLLQSVFFEKHVLVSLGEFSNSVPAVRIPRPQSGQELADFLSQIFSTNQERLGCLP